MIWCATPCHHHYPPWPKPAVLFPGTSTSNYFYSSFSSHTRCSVFLVDNCWHAFPIVLRCCGSARRVPPEEQHVGKVLKRCQILGEDSFFVGKRCFSWKSCVWACVYLFLACFDLFWACLACFRRFLTCLGRFPKHAVSVLQRF